MFLPKRPRSCAWARAIFSLSIPLPLFNNGGAALSQATAERQSADARRRLTTLDVDQAIARAQADAANAATNAAAATGPALSAAEEAARIARIINKKFCPEEDAPAETATEPAAE